MRIQVKKAGFECDRAGQRSVTEQNICFLKRQGCENRLDVSLRKKATQESNTLEPTVKRVGKELTLRNTAKPQAYNRKMHHLIGNIVHCINQQYITQIDRNAMRRHRMAF